ncbi:hypothetical protein ABW21_db0206439 [Orbilia brochopaga]|nr:hypothetical protein ABW21_db0206439 [Drechslerella brochopaga]
MTPPAPRVDLPLSDQGIFQLLILTGTWALKSAWWEAVAEELLVRGTATRMNCESNARALLEHCLTRNPNFEEELMTAGSARASTTLKPGNEVAVRKPLLETKLRSMKQKGEMVYKELVGPLKFREKETPEPGALAVSPSLNQLDENSLVLVPTTPSGEGIGTSLVKISPRVEAVRSMRRDGLLPAGAGPMVENTPFSEGTCLIKSTFRDEDTDMDENSPDEGNDEMVLVVVETDETVIYEV